MLITPRIDYHYVLSCWSLEEQISVLFCSVDHSKNESLYRAALLIIPKTNIHIVWWCWSLQGQVSILFCSVDHSKNKSSSCSVEHSKKMSPCCPVQLWWSLYEQITMLSCSVDPCRCGRLRISTVAYEYNPAPGSTIQLSIFPIVSVSWRHPLRERNH